MPEIVIAWCMKCHEKVEMDNPQQRNLASNRLAVSGTCPKCKSKVNRLTSRKAKPPIVATVLSVEEVQPVPNMAKYSAACRYCGRDYVLIVDVINVGTFWDGRKVVEGTCGSCKLKGVVFMNAVELETPVEVPNAK